MVREGYPVKGLITNDFGLRNILWKWKNHQHVNLPRVYGCWQRGDFRGALNLMLGYLHNYDETHESWQQQTYDLFQLWYMADGSRGEAALCSDLFQQTVEEAIRRTITAGNFMPIQLWWGERLARRLMTKMNYRDGTALRIILRWGREVERQAKEK